MASRKSQQSIAKRDREMRVKERRALKNAKKQAARDAPPETEFGPESEFGPEPEFGTESGIEPGLDTKLETAVETEAGAAAAVKEPVEVER
jgi:hypothetical protein